MAKAKSSSPNGILTEFLRQFLGLLGDEFYEIVQFSIQ